MCTLRNCKPELAANSAVATFSPFSGRRGNFVKSYFLPQYFTLLLVVTSWIMDGTIHANRDSSSSAVMNLRVVYLYSAARSVARLVFYHTVDQRKNYPF